MPDQHLRHVRWALLLVWFVPALWAVNYIVARLAPGVVGPYTLAFGRWALAGAVLLLISGAELWRQRSHLRATWWQYFILGICGMVICGAWVYIAGQSTGAMNIALIYAASPVLIVLASVLWLGERVMWRQVAGVVLTLAGVLYVIAKGRWALLANFQFAPGDAWMLAATLSWAGYAVLQKRWPSPLSSTARLAAICVGGVSVLLPCAIWESLQAQAVPWSHQATVLVLLAALLPGLGAYWIYGWSQKVLGASRVAVSLYLGPLYAALAAWGLLGEPLGWHHLLGAALILPGVFWVTRS